MSSKDWSSLLPELLEKIARKLIVHADYIRFRAVCTAWRASTPEIPTHLPCQLPWLMLSQSRYDSYRRAFVTVANNKLHYLNLPEASYPRRLCGSSHGWLSIVDESPSVFLINPLTRAKINLPPLSAFPDVISFDFSNVGREYVIRTLGDDDPGFAVSLQDMRDCFIDKIILSGSPSCGSHFVALAIISRWGELAYCKSDQNSWNFIEEARNFCEDATFFNGLIYVVHKYGTIAVCDVSVDSPVVEIIGKPDPNVVRGDLRYLVNAMGELLLVTRFLGREVGHEEQPMFKTTEFRVFRFNFDGLNWERLVSLGDKVLFLGQNSSMAFLASDYPGCRGNRIYFADDFLKEESEDFLHRGHDLGIFNFEDGIIEPLPCYAQDLRSRLKWPPAIWITPNPCS